jgi:hypothetical protein
MQLSKSKRPVVCQCQLYVSADLRINVLSVLTDDALTGLCHVRDSLNENTNDNELKLKVKWYCNFSGLELFCKCLFVYLIYGSNIPDLFSFILAF